MWRFSGIPIHLPQCVIGSANLREPNSSSRLQESVLGHQVGCEQATVVFLITVIVFISSFELPGRKVLLCL
jgi:hypothetical protein